MAVSKIQRAFASIMSDIRGLNFDTSAVPGQLLLSGDRSFPLAMNSQGHVLMAASQYGSGRIVVLGHESYLVTFPEVVMKAINWLKGDKFENLSVGIRSNVKDVEGILSKTFFKTKVMGNMNGDSDVGVYVTDAYSVEDNAERLVSFMKSGGGVLMAGQAWSWAQNNPKNNTLLEFQGNKVSAVAGIHFSGQTAVRERVTVGSKIPSWKAIEVNEDFREDLEILLRAVSEIKLRPESIASEVLVYGRLSFPICTTTEGRVALAGGYYGRGRVIVAGHQNLFEPGANETFWDNALHWLDQGRQGVIGLDHGLNMFKTGLNCQQTGFKPDLSVYVCMAYSESHIQEILEFVAEGGGLLIGGQAWSFGEGKMLTPFPTEFAGNRILCPMGLGLLSAHFNGGYYKVLDPRTSSQLNLRRILHLFSAHVFENKYLTLDEEERLLRLRTLLQGFLHTENRQNYLYQQILSSFVDMMKRSRIPQVSESSPATTFKDRIIVSLAADAYKFYPNPDEFLECFKVRLSYPTVSNRKVNVSVNTKDGEEWLSTGCYLSPGMKTYLTMPRELIHKGWKVQINHVDKLKLDTKIYKRAPYVGERFPVTSELMLVHNLWGGLIYLIAPPHTQVTGAEVMVHTAVAVPYYKSGVTSLSDWSGLRTAPSPWAELEFDNIILTVPSDVVRSLDRPDELAALWDRVMRAVGDLSAIPHKFERKERIICDVQISAGEMLAGYPIMGLDYTAHQMVSVESAKSRGMWGPVHELGHNQQNPKWEITPNTTESTNNLWAVYVHEAVFSMSREKAHEHLLPAERKRSTEQYIRDGRNLKKDWFTWIALETYLQLQERFGWDSFKKVSAAYTRMSRVPKDNQAKMNLYCVTFSETVGMDLTGFFKAWGWPIEHDTKGKLSNLPAWTNHPMVQYI